MVPIEFWIEARTELEKIKNVYMLAEWDTPEQHKAFDMTYDWALHKTMNAIAIGEKNVTDLIKHLQKDEEIYPLDAFRMQFTSNHDENSWNGTVSERLGDGAEAFAVFTCLIPDMPLVYTGQEAGNDKRLLFFEKDPVEWKEHEFSGLYSKLFALKKENKSLYNGERGGSLNLLNSSDEKNIFAFTRSSGNNKVLAIFNLSKSRIDFTLNGKDLAGSYKNFFTGKLESFNSEERFELDSWEYRLLVK
jgi:glycosidase